MAPQILESFTWGHCRFIAFVGIQNSNFLTFNFDDSRSLNYQISVFDKAIKTTTNQINQQA